MLRSELNAMLREAASKDDHPTLTTLRLVAAALEERDLSSRQAGRDHISDHELTLMLRDMVQQRRAEIQRCENCGQLELAEREAAEIDILTRLLPAPLDENEIERAVDEAIDEAEAHQLRDAGKVVALLKERYPGRVDFGKAKRVICAKLH
ncbi:MAG: GatB/YqeY domain-containing protein [Geminicoccaceae bacterium]